MASNYQPLNDIEEPIDLDKKMTSIFSNCSVLQSNVTQICPTVRDGKELVVVGLEDGKVCFVSNSVQYLKGHTLQVRRVLLSSDHKSAITSSRDKTVKLWDLATGNESSSYDCGSDVVSIAVHRNLVLAGCENGKVCVIDLASSQIHQLEGHAEMIRWVAFAPDGSKLFSLSNDKTVKVYAQDFTTASSLLGHQGWVNRIDFTPDSRWAVTGSTDTKVILWDLERYEILSVFEGHTDQVWSVAVSPDGNWAASGSNDFSVRLWDLKEKTLAALFSGHSHQVPHLKISADSQFVVSGSFDKTIKLWNIQEKRLEATFEGHTHFVRCVEFSEDRETIYSGGADKSLRKWGLRSKNTTNVFSGHSDWIRRLAVVPGKDKFVSAGKDKSVRLWSLSNGLEFTFNGHKDEVWGLAVTPDGNFAVSGSHDKTVKVWDLEKKTLVHTFEGHENWVTFVFITPDGRFAVTPSHDSTIGVWDLVDKSLVCKMLGHQGPVVRLLLSDDGKTVFSSSRDKTVRVWDLPTASLVCCFTEHQDLVLSLGVNRGSSILVTGCNDKTMRFFSLQGKTLIASVPAAHGGDINRILITPDDLWAVSASDDKTIKLWNMRTFQLNWVLEGHSNIVTWLEMTSDGKQVISASRDKTVKVWNLESFMLEATYSNHSDVLYTLAVTPNDRHVVSGSFDKTVAVHKLFNRPDVQVSMTGVYNASLEAVGKVLNYKNQPFSEELKDAIVFPLHVNVLHLYAYMDRQDDMVAALEADTPYFTSHRFGSPMLLAINRNNFEVINAIIEYFGRISTTKPVRFDVFGTLKQDLPELLKIRLRTIADLLTNLPLIGNRTDLIKYIGFDAKLPQINFSDMHEFSGSLFPFDSQNKALIQVNYYAVPFRVNLETGSAASLELLEQLERTPNSNLFVSRLITAIIDYKWARLRTEFILEFLNFATFLVLMCVYLSKAEVDVLGLVLILVFNSSCFFLEILQLVANVFRYFRSFWNFLDMIRIIYCYVFVARLLGSESADVENYYIVYEKIFLMILCWVKGISYFRMFDMTRYFVTMISDILKDSVGFTTIFFYSIICFANLFQLILNDPNSTYLSMFENTFETIFGGGNLLEVKSDSEKARWLIFFFTTLIVTVIMLNLLISIIGDTYDRVQMESAETSNKIKISMIYEIEKMFFWKRNAGSEKYMVICDKIEAESGDWEGKVKTIVQEIKLIEKNQTDHFRSLLTKVSDHRSESSSSIKSLEAKIDQLLSQK